MLSPYILKSVSEPSKRLFAHPDGILFSCVLGILTFFIHPFFGILVFASVQGLMAYLTFRDPYFLDVWRVYLSQRKTKNLILQKGNYYAA